MKTLTKMINLDKKSFFSYSKAVLILGLATCFMACDTEKPKETPTEDTVKVAMDTPKVVGNGNEMIKPDTTPVKVETTKVQPTVENPPIKKETGSSNQVVKGNNDKNIKPDKPKPEPKEDKDIVAVPDELAAPVGGYPAFYKNHVRENLKYPEQAIKEGVEGRVALNFVVSKDGSLSNVKVTQGIGAGCDEEAVRILKQSPKWQPAVHQGKAVKSKATIFISFKIK
jgi:periplasmic protein TonB